LQDRDHEPEDVEPSNENELLVEHIGRELENGVMLLSELTIRVTKKVESEKVFITIGRIADVVARLTRVENEHERTWRGVSCGVEIEEWVLRPRVKV